MFAICDCVRDLNWQEIALLLCDTEDGIEKQVNVKKTAKKKRSYINKNAKQITRQDNTT